MYITAKDCLGSKNVAASTDDSITTDTRFNDSDLLLKTLGEYGLCPQQISPNCFSVKFADGDIIYERTSEDAPFTMTVKNIKDMDGLIEELTDIEQVYDGNVQEYTYQRVLNNLPKGMAIEQEQVMEDDSIVLTLSVG